MPNFRKIPVVIEARLFDPSTDLVEAVAALEWCGAKDGPNGGIVIPTPEDGPDAQVAHYVTPGDWIIRGVSGEFYPCKPDIFAKTYEQVAS